MYLHKYIINAIIIGINFLKNIIIFLEKFHTYIWSKIFAKVKWITYSETKENLRYKELRCWQ